MAAGRDAHLAAGQKKCNLVVGKYRIRKYEERDLAAVHAFYSQGLEEQIPRALWYLLRSPRIHLVLLAVFLATYLTSASFLISLAVVSILLTAAVLHMKYLWDDYIRNALATDLSEIRRTYLEQKDCCFWVVDAGDEVVGMVAAVNPEHPFWSGSARELKRMSVKKEHRGQGLSKALVKTVVQFAQERGYQEVVLSTSMVQVAAQRAYESMGFHKVLELNPTFLAKLVNFTIYCYYYRIPDSP